MTKNQRRTPEQARAIATREAILDAAAHVLETGGEAAFTTNKVAERAGVSIGSLYQYFRNKTGILIALAERAEHDLLDREGTEQSAKLERISPLRFGIRRYIGMLSDTPGARAQVLRAVLEQRGPGGVAYETERRFIRSGLADGLSDVERFVLSRAITGVVQTAVREGYSELKSRRFEDALVDLARGFISRRN